ncbi:type II toxin-antitoxin system MqsA family antitoxin [Polyangium sp. 6x1]|uniref:type II toxin-antitoxin system MqsA family antitoxin n=1 Tax=Polyangium sp. 6x1 TaxID=3042689 RepID=UPI0024827365|nr:type II toxin-antitoxin system MqsA family antitoxin [Polyangium sp. 6x1]MDI1449548.1 type II toxin-antitoxin system MqsA family antitoxin [Polyangium sp. 6x1]
MRCIVCKHGETAPGTVTVSVERAGTVVVVRDVPADVCQTCGEEYLTAQVVEQLESLVDKALGAGMDVAVRRYEAA